MNACLLAASLLLAGCSDPVSHVFAGRLYQPTRGCIEATTSIDVVDGPQPAAPCDRRCLAGSNAIYVSTMCAPSPRGFDTSSTSPACAAALESYDRNDTCSPDGGSAHPLPDASHD